MLKWRRLGSAIIVSALYLSVGTPVSSQGQRQAPQPIDLQRLKACIAVEETANVPYPHGAVVSETLPDGTQTVSRGRFMIAETTLRYLLPGVDASWLHHPVRVEDIMDRLLAKYRERFPKAGIKRIAYCHFAGPNAEPYKRKSKERLAVRVVECYGSR